MDISVVIPLKDESESLPELTSWIHRVMSEHKFEYELIFIDDGSTDDSWQTILRLKQSYPAIRAFSFSKNYGKSAALYVGFEEAKGRVVITMDADLQDSPDEIPDLYKRITVDGFDLVSGWKKKRYDPISKTIPTKLFNWATRKMSGIYLHDFNCGLKAYKSQVIKAIEVYGEMHRYIPVLAKNAGFRKIGEKEVQHYPRKYGKSKFGLSRFLNGVLDLISITFMNRFGKRPMHFFGPLGIFSFLLGFGFSIYLFISKLNNLNNPHARDITQKTSFYVALLAIVIGVQMFLAGFIGELLARSAADRNKYNIRDSA